MSRIPKYRLHKGTGLAVVTLNGRDIYLGKFNTPESKSEYERRIAEWLANGRVVRPANTNRLTVAELVDQYLAYARNYYVKDGQPTSQVWRIERAVTFLVNLYGKLPAAEFGPLKLKAVRQRMVEGGDGKKPWTRRYTNHCVGCIKLMFRWAVAEELVPAEVSHGLAAVAGLKAGRSAAPEAEPIRAAPEASVAAVHGAALPQLAALIELQLQTGMRPGEAVLIRPCDVMMGGRIELPSGGTVDLGPDIWAYKPHRHKTAHHGHGRLVLIGPRGQAALRPYLENRAADAYCFSPAEAMEERRRRRRTLRRTPVQPSQVDRGKANPRKRPGTRYTTMSYAKAVAGVVRRLQRDWHPPLAAVSHWHPHQLRHSCAERLVAEFGEAGWEIARIALGHRGIAVTRIYASDDLRRAADAIRRAG